jgi:hypothetical protein
MARTDWFDPEAPSRQVSRQRERLTAKNLKRRKSLLSPRTDGVPDQGYVIGIPRSAFMSRPYGTIGARETGRWAGRVFSLAWNYGEKAARRTLA